MATYTPNYQLHQWVPEDQFLRTDFNEDFKKIDTALGEKADSASVDSRFSSMNSSITSLRNTDAKKANTADMESRFAEVEERFEQLDTNLSTALTARPEVVIGTFTGDGAATRIIDLGFTPKAVLLELQSGQRITGSGTATVTYGGLAVENSRAHGFSIVTGGFQVYYSRGSVETNDDGKIYNYIVWK